MKLSDQPIMVYSLIGHRHAKALLASRLDQKIISVFRNIDCHHRHFVGLNLNLGHVSRLL
jgi:hypothetical protein|tara:strand:+ start:1528 stop:1707 length:180 start_codon:yes stop_codon:yes gene_type:complete